MQGVASRDYRDAMACLGATVNIGSAEEHAHCSEGREDRWVLTISISCWKH